MTASPPRYKLQHAPGETVALTLLTRSGWSVENFPLYEMKVSNQASFGLDINTLSLTKPCHVDSGPKLASLVQVDPIAESEVLWITAVFVSWW